MSSATILQSENAEVPTRFIERNRAPAKIDGQIVNALSVDIEDYFQVQAFANTIDRSDWDSHPHRVVQNTEKVLEIFSDGGAKGTFFTLGWVAERYPELIRRIVDEGHELASHGMAHFRVHEQTPDAFRDDIRSAKKLLEDTGGVAVTGYRAATFSIGEQNLWAFDILEDEGYQYSSSINPINHDLYGMPNAPRFGFYPTAHSVKETGIIEFPITTIRIGNTNRPCGGGGFFRLFPYALSRWAMRQVNAKDNQPCIFYFHPWEVDPSQPRIPNISMKTRFRHYLNLNRMEARLRKMMTDFAWDRMDRVFDTQSTNNQ